MSLKTAIKAIRTDPIWSKVAAGAILAIIVSLYVWLFPGGWGAVVTGVSVSVSGTWKWLSNNLSKPRSIPTWLLILMGLGGLLVLAAIGFVLWMLYAGYKTRKQPTGRLHEAMFEGLLWRWGIADDGQLLDPTPFCPNCDMQIHPKHLFTGMFPRGPTGYVCDRCRQQILEFRGTYDELVDLLVREQQRLERAARG